MESLSPLEASIAYLVLHLPECDLPERFLPSNNSSNPFITSAHSGQDDLKKRWIEEKAVKEAGWPLQAVKECTAAKPDIIEHYDSLMVSLGRKLIGGSIEDLYEASDLPAYPIEVDEYEALGAHIEDDGHLVLPLFSAPIKIHILFSSIGSYPRPNYIPIYITSTTTAAYVRLHLLSKFLERMNAEPELESGEGFCMAVMRIIEDEWATIEDNGLPDISAVMKHLIPLPQRFVPVDESNNASRAPSQSRSKGHRQPRTAKAGDDTRIRQEFETLTQTDKVWGRQSLSML